MKVVVWSKDNCRYCLSAKNLLVALGIEFEERKIGEGYTKEDLLAAVPHAKTVPQIFIDDEYVGGYDDLKVKLNQV